MKEKKYYSPKYYTYSPKDLLECFGPIQAAYANVQIRATAFNTSTPAINKCVNMAEYKTANVKIYKLEENKTGLA